MEPAEDRSRDTSHVLREVMAGNRGDGQPGRWLWKARAKPAMRAAAVIMEPPEAKDPAQMLFAERD